MSRAIDDLCTGDFGHFDLRSRCMEHIARCTERKVFPYVIDTLRTLAEQEVNVRRGFSKTMNSRHLPQPECGKAHAYDVVPVREADDGKILLLDWDSGEPEWVVLREEAEQLGMTAGFLRGDGRRWDLGHIQQGKT